MEGIVGGDGEIIYYHHDNLGSTRVMTDSQGKIVWEQDYMPFGEDLHKPGTVDVEYDINAEYKFTGQREVKGIGLYYYGARHYDPEIGRFITADSYLGEIGNSQSQNLYIYVMNNPLKYIDPSGYKPMLLESFDEVSKTDLYMDRNLSFNLGNLIIGQDVEFVQGILWYLGFMQTSELGYGSQTQSAIRSFQEKANLEIDGVVGQFTLKALIGAMYYVEGLDYKTFAWQWNSIYSSEIAGPEPPRKYVNFTLLY